MNGELQKPEAVPPLPPTILASGEVRPVFQAEAQRQAAERFLADVRARQLLQVAAFLRDRDLRGRVRL